MSILNLTLQVFDPIRITTIAESDRFIVDTWHRVGLVAESLVRELPGVAATGTGQLPLSSGMFVERPLIRVGVQINNIRATPIEFLVVDDGPAPVLLGSDFIDLLFRVGSQTAMNGRYFSLTSEPSISVESSEKYDPNTLGIRLIPESESVDALQLERFLRGARVVHNIAVLTQSRLHQHDDWPDKDKVEAKRRAVRETILNDNALYSDAMLSISWVESGSIWVSLASGATSGLSWITRLFSKSTDAKLRSVIAEAAMAEEAAEIQKMTREEIAEAKRWEQRRLAGAEIRKTREEWHQTVLEEINFQKELIHSIDDKVVQEEALRGLDLAVRQMIASNLMPIVENVPKLSEQLRTPPPTLSTTA